MSARQDMANASAAMHEFLYRGLAVLGWLAFGRSHLGVRRWKPWIEWRLERDRLLPARLPDPSNRETRGWSR